MVNKPMFDLPDKEVTPVNTQEKLPIIENQKIKQRWLSGPEIGSLALSSLISITLVVSALIPTVREDDHLTYFQNVFNQYEILGGGVLANPTTGQGQYPFGSPLYVISYDKSAPIEAKDRVEDLWQYYVPKLHALSDRHHDYYIEEIYFENPSVYLDSLLTHEVPARTTHERVTEGTLLTNLKMVNDHLNQGELEISYDLYQMLSIGKRMSIQTNSAFNFFVGALSDFWDPQIDYNATMDPTETDPFYHENNRALVNHLKSLIPLSEAEIEQVLVLREENNHYFVDFSQPEAINSSELSITFGGLAKGYANDILESALADEELTQGFFRGGFSSNVAQSRFYNPQVAWHITLGSGMVSLKKDNDIYLGLIYDDHFRLSNSGGDNLGKSYLITNPIDGKIYLRHHIIDVRTGEPANFNIIDVNIFSTSLSNAELDCLTTAMVSQPYLASAALINDIATSLPEGELLHGAFLTYELTSLSVNPAELLSYPIDFSIYHTAGYEQYLYQFNDISLNKID